METIEERAQMCVDKIGILGAYQGYIIGATEQKQIDDGENGKALLYCTDKTATRVAEELIEKFKDWLFDNAPHSVWEEFVDTHAFEGISENEKEIPSKYDADYLQSKIDAHTKYMQEHGLTTEDMEAETCNPDKKLQELTWQDIKRIVEIATEISGYFEYRNGYGEEYYTEVLRRFKEEEQ